MLLRLMFDSDTMGVVLVSVCQKIWKVENESCILYRHSQ